MNQITPKAGQQQGPLADQVADRAAHHQATGLMPGNARPRLTQADADLLYQAFVSHKTPLARQADMIELHNRLVKMFATLNEGLTAAQVGKAAEDRKMLVGRLDELETAVNRMEGALRIEFEPVIRTALQDVVAAQMAPARQPLRRAGRILAILAIGLALGAVFEKPIRAGFDSAAPLQGKMMAILSPNGGS